MHSLNINFNEDKDTWDEFVSTSPQRSIFAFSKFLDSLLTKYDLVTCYDKDSIVAGTIIIYSNSGKPIGSPFSFTQYQGILFADKPTAAAHSRITYEFKLLEYLITQLTANFNTLCLCNSWRLSDLRPFQWHNYHETEKGKFNIDLRYTGVLETNKYRDFDDYVSSIRKVKRQEFRKSSQSLKLETCDNEDILDELHAKTFSRQNIERTQQESTLVRSILRHAIEGNYGTMCIATLNDEPVSAILFLYDDRTAYYLIGANDPLYRNTFAGTFLLTSMIKDAFERGIREVDFVGVNSPNRGDFKIAFNAELKPYFITSISPGDS